MECKQCAYFKRYPIMSTTVCQLFRCHKWSSDSACENFMAKGSEVVEPRDND